MKRMRSVSQAAGNVNEQQQAKTKHLWQTYVHTAAPLMAQQAHMQHKLQASGGYECLALGFPSSQIAETLNLAADLEHSIVQQQERYLFMLSRFIFQVPFFWPDDGHQKPI